jgi:hypothetical protein
MRTPFLLAKVTILLVWKCVDCSQYPEAVTLAEVVALLGSTEFKRDEFEDLLQRLYVSNRQVIQNDNSLYSLVDTSIRSADILKFRSVIEFRTGHPVGQLLFDPTRVLYMVISANSPDDRTLAKMIRATLDVGANPLWISNNRTAAEIVIDGNRPILLHALLEAPSPVSGDAFNSGIYARTTDPEVYRTKVIRQAIVKDKDTHQLGVVLKAAHYYTFVDRYLTKEVILLGFTLAVFSIIFFLYQLRIKRVPINSKLMIPRLVGNRNPWWLFLTYSVATLLSSVPTSNLFECIGLGLASFGCVVWSQLFTGRTDVALVLTISIVSQSILTIAAYYYFAPTNDSEESDKYEDEIDPSSHLYRVMFYPKSRDVSLALTNCAMFLLASTVSFMILYSALDPVHRMYTDCPGASISETYGLNQTLTRVVAMSWDVNIFYCICLRIYRVIDTVNVYGMLAKSMGQKSLPI